MFGDFRRIGDFRRGGRLLGNFRHFGRHVRHFRRIRRGIRHFGNIGRGFGRNVRRRVRHFRRIGDFRRGGRFFRRLFRRRGRFLLLRMHWNRRKQMSVRRHQVVLRLAGNRVICSGLLVRQHFGAAGLDPRRAHNHPIIESNPHRAFAVRARLGVNRAGHFGHIRVARQLLIRVELRAAAEGRQSRHKHVLVRRGGRGFGGSVGRNRRFRRRFGGDLRRIRRIRRRFRGDLRRNRRRGFRHSRLFPDNLLYLRAVCRTRRILRQGGAAVISISSASISAPARRNCFFISKPPRSKSWFIPFHYIAAASKGQAMQHECYNSQKNREKVRRKIRAVRQNPLTGAAKSCIIYRCQRKMLDSKER